MRAWTNNKIVKCVALYNTGISQEEIVRRMRSSGKTIHKYLSKNGIKIRSKAFYSVGSRNPAWKGGRTYDDDGYVLVYAPEHPYKSHNRVREHRLVMERHLKRYLLPTEVIDHINGVRDDNRLVNLRVFSSNAEHLAATLKNHCPHWTAKGRKKLRQLADKRRGHPLNQYPK